MANRLALLRKKISIQPNASFGFSVLVSQYFYTYALQSFLKCSNNSVIFPWFLFSGIVLVVVVVVLFVFNFDTITRVIIAVLISFPFGRLSIPVQFRVHCECNVKRRIVNGGRNDGNRKESKSSRNSWQQYKRTDLRMHEVRWSK